MPLVHGFVDAALVVSAVGDDGLEWLGTLVQQRADLRGVIHVMVGQCRGDDAPGGGVQADVQLTPRAAPARAVRLDQPVPGAAQLHTSAVDQQTLRIVGCCQRGQDGDGLGPAAERGMIRHRQIEPEQLDEGGDQTPPFAAGPSGTPRAASML